MSPDAILLRPMGTALSRRVAAVLAALLVLVLCLSWLACRSLATAPASGGAATALLRSPAPKAPALLAPAGVVTFHVTPAADPLQPAAPLDARVRSLVGDWGAVLRARPDTRVMLTLASNDDTAPLQQRRVGAALVRELVGSDLNPHRVQLALAPAGTTVLSPGDFQLTIEMGRP